MKHFRINGKEVIEAKDLHEAEKYLIRTHPEEYFGANIIQTDGTDFMFIAIKEYYYDVFNTTDDSVILAKIKDVLENSIEVEV